MDTPKRRSQPNGKGGLNGKNGSQGHSGTDYKSLRNGNGKKPQDKNKDTSPHQGGTFLDILANLALLALCPPFVLYFQNSCHRYKCSLTESIEEFYNGNLSLSEFATTMFAPVIPSVTAICIYTSWLLFQAVLMLVLPSKRWMGKQSQAGRTLEYNCINGLPAWIITHVLFFFLSLWPFLADLPYRPLFSPTIVYDYALELLTIVQTIGFVGSIFFYIKARLWPTPDTRFTSNFLFDFFMGTELHPRFFGSTRFDIKLFINGRPGIVAWTLINLSFAAKQYELYGSISNSMILLNILQAIYVVDFFYNEAWYLGTIDIMHDRMGYMLCWGSFVWLPFMYTLQGKYLVQYPVQLTPTEFMAILGLGLCGYLIFRSCNNQKDYFRQTQGKKPIWGRPPKYITAEYITFEGKKHRSMLLASGWWGLARHFNYAGDLMMCLAFSLSTEGLPSFMTGPFKPVEGLLSVAERPSLHLVPNFYFFFMLILLMNRCFRDEQRCATKYGAKWEEYTRAVPWRIIPYVF